MQLSPVRTAGADRERPGAGQDSLYGLVMLVYLLTGATVLPVVLLESFVWLGWLPRLHEQNMPSWLYGYEVMVLFGAAFTLMVAWIPALMVLAVFWRHWRATVPAAAVIVGSACLFLLPETPLTLNVMGAAAVVYALVATGAGFEWLVTRRRIDGSRPAGSRQ